MSLRDTINHFRDRINPDRAEQVARAQGKSEPEIADARKKATRRRRLLRSGAAAGGS